MPFLYEFKIDNEEVNVEMGFSTSRKWEEALDEAKLTIPFSYLNDKPYRMLSLLNIEITEIASYTDRTPIETKSYEFIIYSDRPESVGAYGYYRHNISAIEYTAKLDYYLVRQLAKSRSVIKNYQAPFRTNDDINRNNGFNNYLMRVNLEGIKVNENYLTNQEVVFNQVRQPYIFIENATGGYRRGDAVIKTNATLVSGTSPHTLSNSSATWVFPEGEWTIEYGYIGEEDDFVGSVGFNNVYTFYIEVIQDYDLSMYDVVDEIRDCISKFGGIEDTIYYESTRVFDIDTAYEDLLKNTPAPQIYLANATARQMLIYTLSFINSLPRLLYGENTDILSLERYNLKTGSFEINDVVGFSSEQNTNQIGTRNYQSIQQALANDLDDKSISSPSHTEYQQVRSLEIQLTADNFSFKLPDRSPIYMVNKLDMFIPSLSVENQSGTVIFNETNFDLDLTHRWINIEEWRLKNITTNFPDITKVLAWEEELGLRLNKVGNLYWNIGDTEIKLSDSYGNLFKTNLIRNVVEEALYERVVLNPPLPFITGYDVMLTEYLIDYDIPTTNQYRDWRIRAEYITDERLVIKQDKEDLEQINFYSEMRQNQEESLVNIVRQSRKGYGDLQRTGNVNLSFPKKHISLSDFYEVGQRDINGYTITQIDTHWFNDYAIATYHLTRYHNRIQQATFVNQKYRPFDNFAKNVLDRHEYYGDYLIAIPPNDIVDNAYDSSTKIYSNEKTVKKIVDILLGSNVAFSPNESASVALIRTDGMLDYYNTETSSSVRFISTPITSRGIKGGFVFTFGFQNNQVAGDKLTSRTSGLTTTTYYNEAVRYTDNKGRFSRFGFAIMKDMEFDSGDYSSYPLIENNASEFEDYFLDNTYFWCGMYYTNQPFLYPLVWNKDPLTNAGLSYGLNILSYYVGLYVFGISFFTDNYLVKEHLEAKGAVLYLYTDGTRYELFDDQYVINGYNSSLTLVESSNIEYDHVSSTVSFIGVNLTNVTSWAIGVPNSNNDTIDLLVACNENINGFRLFKKHNRLGVLEIGGKTIDEIYLSKPLKVETIYIIDSQYFEQYHLGDFYQEGIKHQSNISEGYDYAIDIENNYIINSQYFEQYHLGDFYQEGIKHQSNISEGYDYAIDIENNYIINSQYFEQYHLGQFIDERLFYTLKIEEGHDYAIMVQNNYVVNSQYFPSSHLGQNYQDYIHYNVTQDITIYRWLSSGTSPSGGTTCSSPSDDGNVVCDSSTSCSFVSMGAYSSQTDDTTTTPCSNGAERIQCMWGGSAYFCIIQEGTIITTYTNCKTCEVV